MPIIISHSIDVFDQEEFHAVDKVVTGMAFSIHNDFGRFLDERLYQAALAQRLVAQGFDVAREMKMTLEMDGFRKDYFADFLLNGGIIIETKTADTLTSMHKAQALNYLYMCGLHHATLLNLRFERVQHEFVSTSYTLEERKNILWDARNWETLSTGCDTLKTILTRALEEWGARLDPIVYRAVITHFLGGETEVMRDVEIQSQHGKLGCQNLHCLADDIAFSITATLRHPAMLLEHHQRFLQHTKLRAMQWVNLDGQRVTFHTIKRQ